MNRLLWLIIAIQAVLLLAFRAWFSPDPRQQVAPDLWWTKKTRWQSAPTKPAGWNGPYYSEVEALKVVNKRLKRQNRRLGWAIDFGLEN